MENQQQAHNQWENVEALALQLRPFLKIRAEKKRFLDLFSTFNHPNHYKDRDKARFENARDAIEDAEFQSARLLNSVLPITPEDSAAKNFALMLGQALLPMLIEEEIDPCNLPSSENSKIADLDAILVELKKSASSGQPKPVQNVEK